MSVTVDSAKTFKQLQVPSSDLDDGRYAIHTTTEVNKDAFDDKIQYQVWFTTPELDNRTIERLHSLQLLAESRDQGYSDDPSAGNWTWFEVGVYVDASASALKTKDGIDLSWKSHPNRFMSEEYDWSEGMVFDKTHEIFGVLSPGNVIGVRLCARFQGWTIMAKSGFLVVELGPKIAKRTVPEFKPIVDGVNAMQEILFEVNVRTKVAFLPSNVKALGIADTYSTLGDRPLRVLSLDGGGVRGLSSLYILRDVMNRTAKGKKPCEVFDMIAGTSAGGLIAIMLGRLQMSVDECIEKYEALSSKIFAKSWLFKAEMVRLGIKGARYDSNIVEAAFKELVEEKLGDKNAPLLDEEARCKVFVMAVRADAANNRAPVFLRSYTNPQTKSLLPQCLVWEAGRATSAAPTYFSQIKVGGYELVDGGLLANNPLGWLWSEVLDVFGPARSTACFLSIGTGIPANQAVGEVGLLVRGDALAKGLSGAATNTELTNILFKALLNAYAPHSGIKKYWRLNVGEAIPETDNYKVLSEMDDLTKKKELSDATDSYIKAQESLIEDCASTLRAIL